MENTTSSIKLEEGRGQGRPFVILFEKGSLYQDLAKGLYQGLAGDGKFLLVESGPITNSNWEDLTRQLQKLFEDQGVRQASIVGFGAASSITQNLCLYDVKLVRSLVLVDAATRPHPRLIDRFVDRIEHALPLGLPLRSQGIGFDSKSFLQRLRCPILVVTTSAANAQLLKQAELLMQRLPTCWRAALSTETAISELVSLVSDFQSVKAKCPQKNQTAETLATAIQPPLRANRYE